MERVVMYQTPARKSNDQLRADMARLQSLKKQSEDAPMMKKLAAASVAVDLAIGVIGELVQREADRGEDGGNSG